MNASPTKPKQGNTVVKFIRYQGFLFLHKRAILKSQKNSDKELCIFFNKKKRGKKASK